MAFDADELVRIENIEKIMNKIQVAITNLASAQQVRQIAVLKQREIDALTTRVASLEAQILVLQSNS